MKPSNIFMFMGSLLCAVTPFASAQSEGESPQEDEQVFELSPFIVSERSDSYVATTAISGTRVVGDIKDTPISLEILTSKLLEDQGATSFKDSLTYSAGIFTESFVDNSGANPESGDRSPSSSARVGDPRNNAIIIRGFNAPFQQRLGFRLGSYIGVRGASTGQGSTGRGGLTLGGIIDTINVERIEIVRGPGALLYGLGVISGIANILPKEPLNEYRTSIQFGVGTEDFRRGAIDTTGPLLRGEGGKDLLNYRLMAAHQEVGDWTDYYLDTTDYYAFQLKWFPIDGLSIFGEVQGGRTRIDGIGEQYLLDNPENYWRDPYRRPFRNQYGELYRWGHESWEGRYPDIWNPEKWDEIWGDDAPPPEDADLYAVLEEPFLGPSSRISGPDTYYQRDEISGTLKGIWDINEHLSITAGVYYTKQEIEERSLVSGVFFNEYTFGQNERVVLDPKSGSYDPSGEYADYGFGMLNPVYLAGSPNDQRIYRGVRYYWTLLPTEAESLQAQIEARYTFDTDFLDATHSILVGRQEIQDTADLPLGTWNFDRGEVKGNPTSNDPTSPLIDLDAVRVRSFYDWNTPIRYEGEDYVMPGFDYYTTKLWYQGTYGVYHGKFFDDRIAVIGGVRRDRFEGYEEKWRRLEGRHEKDLDYVSGYNNGAVEDGYDDTYVGITDIPGVADAYYNFEDAITVDTGSIAFTYKINEAFNFYAVMAQGVIPNTGVRDGAGLSIAPEETLSTEFGLKFDAFDGMISGTISVFRIDRDNAIWNYYNAPAPGKWEGGRNPFQGNDLRLDVESLVNGVPRSYAVSYQLYFRELVENENSDVAEKWRRALGIQKNERFGTLFYNPGTPRLNENGEIVDFPGDAAYGDPYAGIVYVQGSPTAPDTNITDDNRPYVFIDYETLDQFPELRAIMEQAFADASTGNHPEEIQPIRYGAPSDTVIYGYTASANRGGAVTYEERAEGVDGQITFSPLAAGNLQLIFNFSHVEREAISNFNLAAAVDHRFPEFGNIGTEYDAWVRDFGRENFEDPTDPTTLKGGVVGKSFYYGAEDNYSLWGKYGFIEGALKNLEIGFGARYTGPMRTSIPINQSASENRYQTPDTEAYMQFDAFVGYSMELSDSMDLRLRLNLYNLTDKDTLETKTSYQNVDYPEVTEERRTLRYLDPFRMRLTAELRF
jgi:outer membrane receptor protein involved in Fe transport